jgi:NTE family protein
MTTNEKDLRPNRPIFLALQGGGAKGIVHVGGLLAIDKLELEIRGISGTSAGSMVAALISAGYKGKDMVDPLARTHIFQTLAAKHGFNKPTDLFTKGGWRTLRAIRYLASPKENIKESFAKLTGGQRFLALSTIPIIFYLAAHFPHVALCAIVVGVGYGAYKLLNGLTSIEKVRTLIDAALADALERKGVRRKADITFKDLAKANCIPLKIVATNASEECLELFCLDRTPNVVVADAVAASICLPIIFEPWCFPFQRETEHVSEVVNGKFVDGGLMSNLPAWPFDEERLLYPETTTVALSIKQASDGVKAKGRHWLPSVINAIVSGTGEIHTRAAGKTVKIPLATELGMLDFDVDVEKVYKEVGRTELSVTGQLTDEIIVYPNLLNDVAQRMRDGFHLLINEYEGLWHDGGGGRRVRVALGVQRGGTMRSLSLAFSAGYDRYDKDFGITLPLDNSIQGAAWESGDSVFHDFNDTRERPLHAADNIWKEIQWVVCIPLSHTDDPKTRPCVITIDSNIAVNYKLPNAKTHLAKFVERALQSAEVYNKDLNITGAVQGVNSWL